MDILNTIKKADLFAALRLFSEKTKTDVDDFVIEGDQLTDDHIHKFVKLIYSSLFPDACCKKSSGSTMYMVVDKDIKEYRKKLEENVKKLEAFESGFDLEDQGFIFKYENANATRIYEMLMIISDVKQKAMDEKKEIAEAKKNGVEKLKKNVEERKMSVKEKLAAEFAEISERKRREAGG